MTRTGSALGALVALFCLLVSSIVAQPQATTTRISAVPPVILPAPQTSVTSTAFNPAIQNPGGTTNSAGTFDVQSLSRSSNYVYDSNLPQTTTYMEQSAAIAGQGDQSTPGYYSNQASESSAIVVSQIAPSRVTSLPASSTSSGRSQQTSSGNGALALSLGHGFTSCAGTIAMMAVASLFGAIFVL